MADVVDFLRQQDELLADNARGQLAMGIDGNADNAARSLQMSQSMGLPAPAIYADFDNAQRDHKTAMAQAITSDNKWIRDYINSHPLAATVSHDDIGNLDAVSEHLTKLGLPRVFSAPNIVANEAWKAFKEAYGDDPWGSWAYQNKTSQDFAKNYPLAWATITGAAVPFEVALRTLGGGIAAAGAGVGAVGEEAARAMGQNESEAKKLGADLHGMVESYLMGTSGVHRPEMSNVDAMNVRLREAVDAAKPYLEQGKLPPAGVHPLLDQMKAEQNKHDVTGLLDTMRAAEGSATRERAPELFAENFVKQFDLQDIGIDGQALLDLYGEKAPAPDDGLFGWVPGITEKLQDAMIFGGDVKIPVKDLLAHGDAKVLKQVEDFIRTRPENVTKAEEEYFDLWHGSPHEFEAFDVSKIGTGEGAQSFGHGLYGAEAKGVATDYQKKLSAKTPDEALAMQLANSLGTPWAGLSPYEKLQMLGEVQKNPNIAQELGSTAPLPAATGGNLYRFRVHARKSQFLDWDKPLSEQSESVRAALETAISKRNERIDEEIVKLSELHARQKEAGLKIEVKNTADHIKVLEGQKEILPYMTGEQIYTSLFLNVELGERADIAGSKALHKAGIPGIKYLDQGSRPGSPKTQNLGRLNELHEDLQAAETPEAKAKVQKEIDAEQAALDKAQKEYEERATRNYVIFDDKITQILERNGQALRDAREAAALTVSEDPSLPEHIVSAAIKAEGQTFTGTTHSEAWASAAKALGREDFKLDEDNGFITSKGRYLDRDEAGRVAAQAKQIPGAQMLHSNERMSEVGGKGEARTMKERAEAKPATEAPQVTNQTADLTKPVFKKLLKLIEQRQADDRAWAEAKAEQAQKRKQTKEWKAAREEMRGQVAEETEGRPEIDLDRRLERRALQINPEGLTEEQRAALPERWLSEKGADIDALAEAYHLDTGEELIDRLAQVQAERSQANMTPGKYFERIVDLETDRRMEARFGDLDQNILEEAKDQAISETQVDLMHEKLVADALVHGLEGPLSKKKLKAAAQLSLRDLRMGDISSDGFMAEAGRAGRQAFDAMVKGDPAEALRLREQQLLAVLRAKEAMKFEKAKGQFDKLTKRYAERQIKTGEKLVVPQEYTDWVHFMMKKLGLEVKRSGKDWTESVQRGEAQSLREFSDAKASELRDLYIPDFMFDPEFSSKVDDLTGEQFLAAHEAMKAMDFNGRNELTIERAGEKRDLNDTITSMVEQIKKIFPKAKPRPKNERGVVETVKSIWWSHVMVETMLNRLDENNPRGIFNQTLVRQFTTAGNEKAAMLKEFDKKLRAAAGKLTKKELNKPVENGLFFEKIEGDEDPREMKLTRRHVLGVLQHIGNESNLNKLAAGFGIDDPMKIVRWVEERTTKEDWDRAQKIGDLFSDLLDKTNVMSRSVSGVDTEPLALNGLTSKFGEYEGWYSPIKYDEYQPGRSKKVSGQASLEGGDGYFRAPTTFQGHLKSRTGYVAPMEITLDAIPARMKQMIHDITMRPAVLELAKVLFNPRFQNAVTNRYSRHVAAEFKDYLRDIAQQTNIESLAQSFQNSAVERLRQNTIGTLIGGNPSTFFKHTPTALVNSLNEVGPINFARETLSLLSRNEGTGQRNFAMAYAKSEELQRRLRNFKEIVTNKDIDLSLTGAKFRDVMIWLGQAPVAGGDFASAVPTWLAKYKAEIAAGSDEGMAVFLADRAVRNAHGSSAYTNKPSIARSQNAIAQTYASLYGFFSHILQKQYNLMWDTKRTAGMFNEGEYQAGLKNLGKNAWDFAVYVAAPAMIEELVTPMTNEDHESWGVKAGKGLAMGVSSSFILVRDLARSIINVRDPQPGTIGVSMKAVADLTRDLQNKKGLKDPEVQARMIQHTTTLMGVLTGLTNAQEGRVLGYMYKRSKGLEPSPRGPWQTAVGLRYGTTKNHSATFKEWMNGH